MTKQQSLVIIVGCLVAVLMCVGVIFLVQQSAQAVVGDPDVSSLGAESAVSMEPL
ncbi:hypothetical protein [Paramicrobacterium chengjingii]|uniref:hypothetical protein n=1 Tax=Paramicrobacterium chengjingii TaxID=2769067 RepID=UPI00142256CC|nr:hypothetical protein [Microbacterium chengjingii]